MATGSNPAAGKPTDCTASMPRSYASRGGARARLELADVLARGEVMVWPVERHFTRRVVDAVGGTSGMYPGPGNGLYWR